MFTDKYIGKETRQLSEKEKEIVEKLTDAIPKMNDFQKGYMLGMVEGSNSNRDEPKKESEVTA